MYRLAMVLTLITSFPLWFYFARETLVNHIIEGQTVQRHLRKVGIRTRAHIRGCIVLLLCTVLYGLVTFIRQPGVCVSIINSLVNCWMMAIYPALAHKKLLYYKIEYDNWLLSRMQTATKVSRLRWKCKPHTRDSRRKYTNPWTPLFISMR